MLGYYFYRLLAIKFFLLTSILLWAQQDDLTRYKAVSSLNKLTGLVDVYYPDGYKNEAVYTQAILEKAMYFYRVNLNFDIPVAVALFGPKELDNFSLEKWGDSGIYHRFLPFIAPGPPAVMCLPVVIKGSGLENMILAAIKQNKNPSISSSQISTRLITSIGIHELGHVIMNELEIQQPVRWYNEFMANYIAYAFTSQPESGLQVNNNDEAAGGSLQPTDRHFGGMFNGNTDNYIWWQASLQKRVAEMYPYPGIRFISQLACLRNAHQYFDDLSMLVAMDIIAPGFLSWAKKQEHINENDNQTIKNLTAKMKDQVVEAIRGRSSLYTSFYSNKWLMSDSIKSNAVMKFLYSWERNQIDTSLFSNWVEYKYDWKKRDSILNTLKKEREQYVKWKVNVESIIPLKSEDRNEEWVTVTGSIMRKDSTGNLTIKSFTHWYKMDKNLKITYFKEFVE